MGKIWQNRLIFGKIVLKSSYFFQNRLILPQNRLISVYFGPKCGYLCKFWGQNWDGRVVTLPRSAGGRGQKAPKMHPRLESNFAQNRDSDVLIRDVTYSTF